MLCNVLTLPRFDVTPRKRRKEGRKEGQKERRKKERKDYETALLGTNVKASMFLFKQHTMDQGAGIPQSVQRWATG
jgi:hypothetical protein